MAGSRLFVWQAVYMSDGRPLRKAALARPRRPGYLRKPRFTARAGEAFMVAIGIIFGFIAVLAALNFIEFKRVD